VGEYAYRPFLCLGETSGVSPEKQRSAWPVVVAVGNSPGLGLPYGISRRGERLNHDRRETLFFILDLLSDVISRTAR
jgi:hypothetical protein